MTIRVLVREPDSTEMVVATKGRAKALANQMIRDRKAFQVRPTENGAWLFVVEEVNHPNKWEAGA